MRVDEIRNLARGRGIKTGKLTKGELVRAIQRDEGNCECYGGAGRVPCDQAGCLWFADCQTR
jgi:hypothetical protein